MKRAILILGSAQYSDRSWVNCQQVASRLAARHDVLFVDSIGLRPLRPTGVDLRRIARRLKDALGGTRRSPEGVWIASPIVRSGPGLRSAVRSALRRSGIRPDCVIAYLPAWASIVEDFPDALRIYHCVDAFAENPGVDREAIMRMERRLLRCVDAVWAVSPPLRDRLTALHPAVRLVPNVADTEAFEAAAGTPTPVDMEAVPRPRILYLGNLASYKIDGGLIERLALREPGWTWVLVGPVGRGDPSTSIAGLARLPNVRLLGEKSRDEAPAYVAAADVCALPLRRGRSTESSHPLKVYEYLASGRPVVATPIPAIAGLIDGNLVRGAHGDEEWREAIAASLGEGGAGAHVRQAEARRHGWPARIAEIEAWLEEARAAGRKPTRS